MYPSFLLWNAHDIHDSTKPNIWNIPSLSKLVGPNSCMSASNLNGPTILGKVVKGTASNLGDQRIFEISKSSSFSLGTASSTSKTKHE